MTYTHFMARLTEAAGAASEDRFITDVGFSAEEPLGQADFLKSMHLIYAAAHEDVRSVLNGYRLTRVSRLLGMPYNTLQNWASGERVPPVHTVRLLAFALVSELEKDFWAQRARGKGYNNAEKK